MFGEARRYHGTRRSGHFGPSFIAVLRPIVLDPVGLPVDRRYPTRRLQQRFGGRTPGVRSLLPVRDVVDGRQPTCGTAARTHT